MDASKLIETARGDGPEAEAAAASLVAAGAAALPPVIAAIRAGAGAVWRLQDVALSLRGSELVPELIQHLGDPSTDVAMTVFEALGRTREHRALEPLLGALAGSRRELAITALGDLADPGAVPKLLEIVDGMVALPGISEILDRTAQVENEEVDEAPLRLLPKVLIALAKLGSFERASLLAGLSHYRSKDPYSDASLIRIESVEAMQHVYFPGMFQELKAALGDEDAEVRLKAVDALFYLGTREAIEELLAHLKDPSSTVVSHIVYRLQGLTADRLEGQDGDAWWREHQKEYSAGVCHRLGQPMDVSRIISLLEDPADRKSVLQELRIITGQDFGFNPAVQIPPPDEVAEQAREWWRKEGHRFETGRLYKYGHQQDLKVEEGRA